MRFYLFILVLGLVAFVLSRLFHLLIQGKLFEEGAIKESFRESGATLWLGMRLFVIIWLLYLSLVWLVKRC
ncbi:hypothetical protein EH223_03300 [candidate division KSB1 bacterium]|nr:hypothetical protein [candidate division KSB1 bacterium]RQW06005.1 MAG: hypothetical protein EH223_03300 [candidate division KSB1 bacterium]